jgi:hypothetical protein
MTRDSVESYRFRAQKRVAMSILLGISSLSGAIVIVFLVVGMAMNELLP